VDDVPVVRAIDVGYGWTKWVSTARGKNVVAETMPSIAPRVGRRTIGDLPGQLRNTVTVTVKGQTFEVGPEARLAKGRYFVRIADDAYCLSQEYMALTLGALSYMRPNLPGDRIDLLVVGLPVSTFARHGRALTKELEGEHALANGARVQVREALVLTQPHGTLYAYGAESNRFGEMMKQTTLVVDCGARTFDWLVVEGLKTVDPKSRAVNRGMLDVLEHIAEEISEALGERYNDLDRIDLSLRLPGQQLNIMGRPFDMSRSIESARHVAVEAVREMRRHIDAQNDSAAFIDNIVLTGGGAFYFKPAIEQAFPKHDVKLVRDGMLANVRGFQLAGMAVMQQRGEARRAAARPSLASA
jgi:plasmid segregation protein ParM